MYKIKPLERMRPVGVVHKVFSGSRGNHGQTRDFAGLEGADDFHQFPTAVGDFPDRADNDEKNFLFRIHNEQWDGTGDFYHDLPVAIPEIHVVNLSVVAPLDFEDFLFNLSAQRTCCGFMGQNFWPNNGDARPQIFFHNRSMFCCFVLYKLRHSHT